MIKEKIKGVSLIWTIIIITIVMIIVAASVTTTSQEAQIATGSEQSNLAYSLARTGIEVAYTEGCSKLFGQTVRGNLNNGNYTLVMGPGSTTDHCFPESTGTVGSVSRKIKAEIKPEANVGDVLDFPQDLTADLDWSNLDINAAGDNYYRSLALNSAKIKDGNLGHSFKQQFDLFRDSSDTAWFSAVGTANYSGGRIDQAFRVAVLKDNFVISYVMPGTTLLKTNNIPYTGDVSTSTNFRIKIDYSEPSGIFTVKILKDTGGTSSGQCVGSTTFHMGSYTFNRISIGEFINNSPCILVNRDTDGWIFDNKTLICGQPSETPWDRVKDEYMAISPRPSPSLIIFDGHNIKTSFLLNMKFIGTAYRPRYHLTINKDASLDSEGNESVSVTLDGNLSSNTIGGLAGGVNSWDQIVLGGTNVVVSISPSSKYMLTGSGCSSSERCDIPNIATDATINLEIIPIYNLIINSNIPSGITNITINGSSYTLGATKPIPQNTSVRVIVSTDYLHGIRDWSFECDDDVSGINTFGNRILNMDKNRTNCNISLGVRSSRIIVMPSSLAQFGATNIRQYYSNSSGARGSETPGSGFSVSPCGGNCPNGMYYGSVYTDFLYNPGNSVWLWIQGPNLSGYRYDWYLGGPRGTGTLIGSDVDHIVRDFKNDLGTVIYVYRH